MGNPKQKSIILFYLCPHARNLSAAAEPCLQLAANGEGLVEPNPMVGLLDGHEGNAVKLRKLDFLLPCPSGRGTENI